MPLFMESIKYRADDAEVLSTLLSAEGAGDFLFDFGHANGALSQVIGEGNIEVGNEAQH